MSKVYGIRVLENELLFKIIGLKKVEEVERIANYIKILTMCTLHTKISVGYYVSVSLTKIRSR
jgi:hypothetical protein